MSTQNMSLLGQDYLCLRASRSSIILKIVETWYTKWQRHKERWPHFSSFRVHLENHVQYLKKKLDTFFGLLSQCSIPSHTKHYVHVSVIYTWYILTTIFFSTRLEENLEKYLKYASVNVVIARCIHYKQMLISCRLNPERNTHISCNLEVTKSCLYEYS